MPIFKVGNKHGQYGFTLIEAIVSIVILAAVTALVVPSFNSVYQNTILKSTARSIAGSLRFARASAIGLNRGRTSQFDLQHRNFAVDGRDRVDLPKGIEISLNNAPSFAGANEMRITFYPHGGSSGGGFVLHNRHKSLLLRVNPITGKVSVNEHAPN